MGEVQVEPPPATSRRVRAVSMLVYLVGLACWVAVLGLPKQILTGFLWIWLATVAWDVRAPWRTHLAFPRDWWPSLAVLTLYLYSRGIADQLGFVSVHVTQPVRADRWLFGGTLPTAWLQARLCGVPCLRTSSPAWYDVMLTTVYYSFFFVPLVTASAMWRRSRSLWVAFMRRWLSLTLVALVCYVIYPMAPPWMAAQEGVISPDVDRITSRGWYDVGEVGIHETVSALTNQVAAMPSLHAAVSLFVAVFGISRLRTRWRWLLLLYPTTMGFLLVYDAEHYVVDILAGYMVSAVVLTACSGWERRRPGAEGVSAAFRRPGSLRSRA